MSDWEDLDDDDNEVEIKKVDENNNFDDEVIDDSF